MKSVSAFAYLTAVSAWNYDTNGADWATDNIDRCQGRDGPQSPIDLPMAPEGENNIWQSDDLPNMMFENQEGGWIEVKWEDKTSVVQITKGGWDF